MLRGSYAGGSLAVTARCPCRRSGPSANPACPRPGSSSRTKSARDASRSRCRRFAKSRLARPCPRHSRLCYSSARPGFSLHCRRSAGPCCSFALSCISNPPLFKSPTSFAFAMSCFALPSPGPAPQSNAFAARISPSPLHAAALLRRCLRCFAPQCRSRSWHLMAELPNASAHRFVASPSRGRSLLCSSLAMTSFAALVHSFAAQRHSKPSRTAHCLALPSPRSTSQCLSFADLGSAVHFHRLAAQIKAFPLPIPATHFLRSSRLIRASPSRGCAPLCSSFPSQLCSMRSSSIAALSKPTRFRCQAFRRISVAVPLLAVLLLRQAHHRKASPLLLRADQRLSFATPILATPLHGRAWPR